MKPSLGTQMKLNRIAENGRLREIVEDYLKTTHTEVDGRMCNNCSVV